MLYVFIQKAFPMIRQSSFFFLSILLSIVPTALVHAAQIGVKKNNVIKNAQMVEAGDIEPGIDLEDAYQFLSTQYDRFARIQFALASAYMLGNEHINRDEDRAFRLFFLAAQQGNRNAQHNVAYAYQMGIGTAINIPQAIYWFRQATEGGLLSSALQLGILLNQENDIEALQWLRMCAENHIPEAQVILGNVYADGRLGVPQNFQEAATLYLQAANQGLANAQYNYGFFAERGLGMPQNLQIAVDMYRRAAPTFPNAQFRIGYILQQHPNTVSIELNNPIYWYCTAAVHGHREAQLLLGFHYLNGGESLAACPNNHAIHWFSLAAANGSTRAMFQLANLYLEGSRDVSRNIDLGLDYLIQYYATTDPEQTHKLFEILRSLLDQRHVELHQIESAFDSLNLPDVWREFHQDLIRRISERCLANYPHFSAASRQ